MNRITVFCGSSLGNDKDFELKAQQLGEKLALENIELVYGGANVGLMGVVANGVLEKSGVWQQHKLSSNFDSVFENSNDHKNTNAH